MQASDSQAARLEIAEGGILRCFGDWTFGGIESLEPRLTSMRWPAQQELVLDGEGIQEMDTAGAWVLHRLQGSLHAAGKQVQIRGLSASRSELLVMVEETGITQAPAAPRPENFLEWVGRKTVDGWIEMMGFLAFTGETVVRLLGVITRPWRIRWAAVFSDMQISGLNALPIVGLLCFLLGVVIAYQGAVQMKLYGAEIYVADLVGLAMTRELAPMMAAIIMAGRTGSAYAAQIGTMMITEEVAALRSMGLVPMELLVLPRVISLIVVLPLLSVFADITGLLGGYVMLNVQLGIGHTVYLEHVSDAVSLRSFFLGVGKAPVFAGIIAIVGCYQGFQVRGSAASVGRRTTVAVVQSIFLVIVADALFSILFGRLGL